MSKYTDYYGMLLDQVTCIYFNTLSTINIYYYLVCLKHEGWGQVQIQLHGRPSPQDFTLREEMCHGRKQ